MIKKKIRYSKKQNLLVIERGGIKIELSRNQNGDNYLP